MWFTKIINQACPTANGSRLSRCCVVFGVTGGASSLDRSVLVPGALAKAALFTAALGAMFTGSVFSNVIGIERDAHRHGKLIDALARRTSTGDSQDTTSSSRAHSVFNNDTGFTATALVWVGHFVSLARDEEDEDEEEEEEEED
jgi:hypothetical protein